MNSLQTAKENLNSAKNWGLVVLLGLVAERRKKYSRRKKNCAYHEYLERIGLASVEEHELTGLTKEFTEAELLKREKEIEQRIEKAKQTREEFDEAMV